MVTIDFKNGTITLAGVLGELETGEYPVRAISAHGSTTRLWRTAFVNEHYLLDYDDIRIELQAESKVWTRFRRAHLVEMVDILATCAAFPEIVSDLLWIEAGEAGSVWAFLLLQSNKPGYWDAQLWEVQPPEGINTIYLLQDPDTRQRSVRMLFQNFIAFLPQSHLTRLAEGDPNDRLLTLKVHRTSLWLLRFPFIDFAKLQCGRFGRYVAFEYIVTQKSFLRATMARNAIHEDLEDISSVLTRMVVVVNTYHTHADNPLWETATRLLRRILNIFQNVRFSDRTASLQWFFNPTAAKLNDILRNSETKYFLADFEAATGCWQLGQGARESWAEAASGATETWRSDAELFDLRHVDLSHIHLMRVYHCNSIFDAYDSAERQPADEGSLVQQLLSAGAERVEGAMTQESYFDFICSIFDLLCRPPQMRFVLQAKCFELNIDQQALLMDVNGFLQERQRDPIAMTAPFNLKESK